MAYLSFIADIIGVGSGVVVFGAGLWDYLKNRKKNPDADETDPSQESNHATTVDE